MVRKRIFLAIGISKGLQKEIAVWEGRHKDIPVRWLLGKNLHVTLVPPWYEDEGGMPKMKELIAMAGGVPRFSMQFEEVTYGPNAKTPRLIWASGEAPKEIFLLKHALEERIGGYARASLARQASYKPFRMHITLARFREEDFSSFPRKDLHERVEWEENVRSFVLMESRLSPAGSDYEILEEVGL